MPVYQVAGAPVHYDLLNPANVVKRIAQGVLLSLRVDAPVVGIGQELVWRFLASAHNPVTPRLFLASNLSIRHSRALPPRHMYSEDDAAYPLGRA